MLLFTNIRTGFFKETEARSLTCQAQRQGCSSASWGAEMEASPCSPQVSSQPPAQAGSSGTAFSIHCPLPGDSPRPTSSVIVAEKSIVWRWCEHIRMISFICSSKYSSSILGSRGGRQEEWAELVPVEVRGREQQTGDVLVLSLVMFQARVLTYFISINRSHYDLSFGHTCVIFFVFLLAELFASSYIYLYIYIMPPQAKIFQHTFPKSNDLLQNHNVIITPENLKCLDKHVKNSPYSDFPNCSQISFPSYLFSFLV